MTPELKAALFDLLWEARERVAGRGGSIGLESAVELVDTALDGRARASGPPTERAPVKPVYLEPEILCPCGSGVGLLECGRVHALAVEPPMLRRPNPLPWSCDDCGACANDLATLKHGPSCARNTAAIRFGAFALDGPPAGGAVPPLGRTPKVLHPPPLPRTQTDPFFRRLSPTCAKCFEPLTWVQNAGPEGTPGAWTCRGRLEGCARDP